MRTFAKIRCVTFDLDDTLWPCEPTISNAEQVLYTWLEDHYPRVTRKYPLETLKKQRAAYGKAHPELAHDVTELRRQSLAKLAEEFGYPHQMARDGLALFHKFRNKVNFFDDAFTTIERLKNHFKIGAITNGNADLAAIGISEKFDFVVTAEKVGVMKPNGKIFQYAQHKAQLERHEMLFVGDTPDADVLGAQRSGWRAIWFNPHKTQWLKDVKPDAEIHKLSQLPTLLLGSAK